MANLYVQDGAWNGARLLPDCFVDQVKTVAPASQADGRPVYVSAEWAGTRGALPRYATRMPDRHRSDARRNPEAPRGGRQGSDSRLPPTTFRARVAALRNVTPFLRLVWQTSPALTSWTLAVRLLRALLPVVTLYVGKLIIDEVVRVVGTGAGGGVMSLAEWSSGGRLHPLAWLLAAEFGLAVLSDVLGRVTSLIDSLLNERFNITTSVRLMEHAATLDLQDFEDSESQDKLERARRQASGRTSLMSQLFGQVQDLITILSLAAGLAFFNPWLILLLLVALIPSFLGEAHFSARSYQLAYTRTADQRNLDYLRRTGASAETAKEVKIFALHPFLIERYRELATSYYRATRSLAVSRAWWGTLLTTIGTLGYYGAFAYLAWRTVAGEFSIGDLTFGAASFRRLRGLLEGLLDRLFTVGRTGTLSRRPLLVLRHCADDRLASLSPPLPAPDARWDGLRGCGVPLSQC